MPAIQVGDVVAIARESLAGEPLHTASATGQVVAR
jgi:hypothetical protein